MRSLDIFTALSAFGAAAFWGWASVLKIPTPKSYYDFTPDNDPFTKALKKASRLNSIAAMLAAVSALLSGIKLFFF